MGIMFYFCYSLWQHNGVWAPHEVIPIINIDTFERCWLWHELRIFLPFWDDLLNICFILGKFNISGNDQWLTAGC
jgi:hypothetical protein